MSRINFSDFFGVQLYFFWTNFYYLYYFVFSLFIYWLLLINNFKNLNLIFIFILLISSFILLILNYWLSNFSIYFIKYELLNSLLINNINKYHPILFYLSTLLLISYILEWKKKRESFIKQNLFIKNLLTGFLVMTVTLFFGSWWAFQEGSWGGWWNWDPSEVFGLVIAVTYLIFLHYQKDSIFLYKNSNILLKLTCLILILFLTIQLNFDFISHNFGTRTSFFVYLRKIFTVEIILFSFFIILSFKKSKINFRLIFNFLLKIPFKTLIFTIIWIFIILISLLSLVFFDLDKMTIYKTTEILLDFRFYIILTFTLILIYSWIPAIYLIILIFFLSTTFLFGSFEPSLIILLIFTKLSINFFTISHILIFILIYANIDTYFKVVSFFTENSSLSIIYVSLQNFTAFLSENMLSNLINFEKSILYFLDDLNENEWFSKFITFSQTTQIFKTGLFNSYFTVIIFEFGYITLISLLFYNIILFFYKNSHKLKLLIRKIV